MLRAAFLSSLLSIYLWLSWLRAKGACVGIRVSSVLAFGGCLRSVFRRG